MNKKVKFGILGAAGALTAATVVKAAKFKPEKTEKIEIENRKIDSNSVAEHLSNAIQCKTISKPGDVGVDWAEFEKLHKYLDDTYPLIKKNLT
ncbi:MAG: hypothetical protein KBT46_07835, partial [Ruminococcus sp.]|nr:hypothetical protein [Candidatus Copronaster equi]